ncbi:MULTISPECIES: TraH family protein [unclassified Rhizobium]|uniref:TraH family protein n=1 Tax=unclassified Rhizobium TaxID=2613769 RepID=UPI00381C141E
MLDAALIKECADPSLPPAIVERFVDAAGSADPLAVTVRQAGRLILVPKAITAEAAIAIVRQYAGRAIIRVGLTQVPAGIGVTDPSVLKPDLFDPCSNLRSGTVIFAKVLRIVAKWYGSPKGTEAGPQILADAIYAWKTGEFEGINIFRAADPGPPATFGPPPPREREDEAGHGPPDATGSKPSSKADEPGTSGIRIDLSRIEGK